MFCRNFSGPDFSPGWEGLKIQAIEISILFSVLKFLEVKFQKIRIPAAKIVFINHNSFFEKSVFGNDCSQSTNVHSF